MYDVIYIDGQGKPQPVASALPDRQEACRIARQAAVERHSGRMVADSLTRAQEGRCRNTVLVMTALPQAA